MIIKNFVNENNSFLTFEKFKNKYQVNIISLITMDWYMLFHRNTNRKYNHMQIAVFKQNIKYSDCYEKKISQNACAWINRKG